MPPSVPLDAIRLPAAIFDTDGRVAAVNELAEAMAGRPVVGLSAADLSARFDVRSPDGTPVGDAGSMVARVLGGEMIVDLPPSRSSSPTAGASTAWRRLPRSARATRSRAPPSSGRT